MVFLIGGLWGRERAKPWSPSPAQRVHRELRLPCRVPEAVQPEHAVVLLLELEHPPGRGEAGREGAGVGRRGRDDLGVATSKCKTPTTTWRGQVNRNRLLGFPPSQVIRALVHKKGVPGY